MSLFSPVKPILFVLSLAVALTPSISHSSDACQCTHSFDTSEKTNIYLNGETTTVSPGDIICFQSGTYSTIRLNNIHGTAADPVTVKNCGGQVEIDLRGGSSHGFVINNSTYIHLTGTGDDSLQHGFRIFREPADRVKTGLAVGGMISDIEIDHLEIHDVELGLHLLNVPDCNAESWRGNWVMENVSVHDMYVHDVGNEGFYIGSSKYSGGHTMSCEGQTVTLLPSLIRHIKVYNNHIENSGWDAMQVSVASADCRVFNNRAINWGYKNKPSQRAGIVVGGGSACEVYNNYIETGEGDGIDVFGIGNVQLHNNIIVGAKGQGVFIGNREPMSGYEYSIVNNTIVSSGEDSIRFNNSFVDNSLIVNNLLVDFGQKGINIVQNNEEDVFQAGNLELPMVSQAGFVDPPNDFYALEQTSPAVDAGADVASLYLFFTDHYGIPRPQGAGIDIGAAEFSLSLNRAPQYINRIPDQVCREGDTCVIPLSGNLFVDPDGDPLSLSATLADNSPMPSWLDFNEGDEVFTVTPQAQSAGLYRVKLTATDIHAAANSLLFSLKIVPRKGKTSILYLSLPALLQ